MSTKTINYKPTELDYVLLYDQRKIEGFAEDLLDKPQDEEVIHIDP